MEWDVWSCCAICLSWPERSAQEYVAIRQQQVERDPLRLQHRSLIKDCVCAVVLQQEGYAQTVLACYGLRPSLLKAWQQARGF